MTKILKQTIGNATLYCGDCLESLQEIEGFDAVISDPPFSSGARTDAGKSSRGGMLRGAKWEGDWFSHDNMATHGFLYLMRLMGVSLLDKAARGATAHFFIDWRMYPNLYGALESSGWIVKNLVVWDKEHFGMGTNYRNQHELIIYAEKGLAAFPTHNLGNVIRCAREKSLNHPTEKPVALLKTLVAASTREGQTVIDPFMGSGTTGVACALLGRKFIGMEIDRRHFDTACQRIEAAYGQPDMFVQHALLPAA
ncbi:site-specific DNA-methyltransferase (adenine-specific) [Singulisphaera sp. GP187]|uniref:DNA-methyltransferase n=1 Tax=Singulisphaera sp. GP187 TaxID=1882752 RepID=UPI0009276276|nr:site-specific DNA-methyltransferase [Singulisphaera sp. GP187]SIO34409.1 site-specific DNA-methyltransferase (adenine-specific) [Singulisphaera sp. GP187]